MEMGNDFFSVEDGQPSIVSTPLSALSMRIDDIT